MQHEQGPSSWFVLTVKKPSPGTSRVVSERIEDFFLIKSSQSLVISKSKIVIIIIVLTHHCCLVLQL
jgi:hypothetical protein